MTPMQTAARAEPQNTWQSGLRIREAAPAPGSSQRKPQRIAYADVLRSASVYLRTGWRWLERKRTQQLGSRRLRLAETISLGEKRTVSIVQVDGAQFLIGCSTGSVQLLAVLDKAQSGPRQLADAEVAR
jgi:hypothetical protein